MHAGVILACGNGTFDSLPERGTARSPSDEYDVGIPFTLQGEEQKSAAHLVAHAPSVGVRRGTVKQVALLLHVDGDAPLPHRCLMLTVRRA